VRARQVIKADAPLNPINSISAQFLASGDGSVLTYSDVWADLYAPTLRIGQKPQKLLLFALVSQANVCRVNADDNNICDFSASRYAHAKAKRRITTESE
jgi:hypothetical protein